MNITITQDNSRIETLGSNGASIILKLYDLAIDSNNTLTLRGNISSTSAYGNLVDYLNTTYGPDFIVSATKLYMLFLDANVLNVLKNTNVGDGVGVVASDFTTATQLTPSTAFENNTNITAFPELCKTSLNNLPSFRGCTNLDVLGIPKGGCNIYNDYLYNVHLSNVFVDSLDDLSLINRPSLSSSSRIFDADLSGTYHIYSYSTGSEIRDITAKHLVSNNSVWEASGHFDLDSLIIYINANMWGNSFKQSTITKVFLMSGALGMTYHQFEESTVLSIYLPTTFTTWGSDVFKSGSLTSCICMSATPFSRTGGDLAQVFYVPDSAVSDWESSFGPSTYWQRTIKTLSQWANIKEENKEDLEFMGCTVTGSFGSYVVTPPTT